MRAVISCWASGGFRWREPSGCPYGWRPAPYPVHGGSGVRPKRPNSSAPRDTARRVPYGLNAPGSARRRWQGPGCTALVADATTCRGRSQPLPGDPLAWPNSEKSPGGPHGGARVVVRVRFGGLALDVTLRARSVRGCGTRCSSLFTKRSVSEGLGISM